MVVGYHHFRKPPYSPQDVNIPHGIAQHVELPLSINAAWINCLKAP